MIASYEIWETLLKSIGIKLHRSSTQVCMTTLDETARVSLDLGIINWIGWNNIECLEYDICNRAKAFVVYTKPSVTMISNPWLGCKSLEELEINKDLAYLQSNSLEKNPYAS